MNRIGVPTTIRGSFQGTAKAFQGALSSQPYLILAALVTIYIVLGATHPKVKAQNGETYRLSLVNRAQHLGVDSSLIFHDRFVSQSELAEFLSAADIYVAMFSQWSIGKTWRKSHLPKINALVDALAARPRIAPIWQKHFGAG